ncbi:MAG TPA: NADPH-dependent assimilatory sulfite reductase hemoprotein subunit [Candidatus Limnocylindrales bacterium]|nr:NADPH-dependent assimilatory sulfite reductase hemoprotein subunit [Candidatus Limnocylindrales bacterium]
MSDESTTTVSGVETLKASSNYLRDPLVAEFAAGGTHITDDGYQILKFHGSYQQDDRDQRNDRRKGGQEFAFGFMIRLRIPGGDIHPDLWVALDDLAARFGRSTIRLTTRQSVQLHFIPKGDLRTVIRTINDHLASTLGACGDVNRNVMAAPLPLADPRYRTVRDAARALSDHLLPRTRAYAELWLDGTEIARIGPDDGEPLEEEPLYGRTYLPRKFKSCVTVAGDNSVDLFTHDLGFAGIFDGDDLVGWNVYVGGGLGRTHRKPETFPRLADPLGFVGPAEFLRAATGVVVAQRDLGDRTNRRHGRLKYLIADRGIDWFRSEVEAASGLRFEPARIVAWNRSDDRLGWHPQGDGRWFAGLRIANGRVRDAGAVRLRTALRAIAREHGVAVRVTPNQNVYLVDVPAERRAPVTDLLDEHGIERPEDVRGLRRLAMACPALPTCGLAIAEAERALPAVLEELQAVFDGVGLGEATPTVRMTGCPNGCARPYVAEIGLVGDAVDRYQVWLGGDGAGTRLARAVAERVHKADLPAALRPLLVRYRDEGEPDEGFGDFVTRAGITALEYVPSVPLRAPREEVPA